jgi:ubiquinone/menaquinone biosynthesis C-methylase UbiE
MFEEYAGHTLQSGLIKRRAEDREDPAESTRICAEAAGLRDGDRVLDAGCGIGGPAHALLGMGASIQLDGVTLSPVQADLARKRLAAYGDRARIQVADYHALPFADATFDLVFFFECTAYSSDPRALYREAARVLKPGGRVYVKDVFRVDRPLTGAETEQLRHFDSLWACTRTGTLAEAESAAASAGLSTRARSYPHVGVTRFLGAMFDPSGRLNAYGARFARTLAPIHFGELIAEKT